jgi:DNA-binding transcriptional ArsR family regulator
MSGNLASLLFGAYRRDVLALLFLHPEASLHVREIARIIGKVPGTLLRELNLLAEAGLLIRKEVLGDVAGARSGAQSLRITPREGIMSDVWAELNERQRAYLRTLYDWTRPPRRSGVRVRPPAQRAAPRVPAGRAGAALRGRRGRRLARRHALQPGRFRLDANVAPAARLQAGAPLMEEYRTPYHDNGDGTYREPEGRM